MKISELIAALEARMAQDGDVEVLVTDGYNAFCYRGEYSVARFVCDGGEIVADIGIGGCIEK